MNRAGIIQGAGIVLLAGLTAFGVSKYNDSRPASTSPEKPDFHQWMHHHLHLDAAQHDALAPIEAAYDRDHDRLAAEIREAGRDLADLLRAGDIPAEDIDAALARLNTAQGELRRVTLHHLLAMKEHLDPEQAELVLQWTHDRIVSE